MAMPFLAIAYALTAALLLNACLSSRWSTGFKATMIILVSGFYAGSYLGLREVQGWPVSEPLPEKFRLHWAHIVEPDKAAGTDGQIYLWVQHLDGADRVTGEPRVYRLPWSLDLAERIEEAVEELSGGRKMNGRLSRNVLSDEVNPDMVDTTTGDTQGGDLEIAAEDAGVTDLEFTALPRSTLPPKSAP